MSINNTNQIASFLTSPVDALRGVENRFIRNPDMSTTAKVAAVALSAILLIASLSITYFVGKALLSKAQVLAPQVARPLSPSITPAPVASQAPSPEHAAAAISRQIPKINFEDLNNDDYGQWSGENSLERFDCKEGLCEEHAAKLNEHINAFLLKVMNLSKDFPPKHKEYLNFALYEIQSNSSNTRHCTESNLETIIGRASYIFRLVDQTKQEELRPLFLSIARLTNKKRSNRVYEHMTRAFNTWAQGKIAPAANLKLQFTPEQKRELIRHLTDYQDFCDTNSPKITDASILNHLDVALSYIRGINEVYFIDREYWNNHNLVVKIYDGLAALDNIITPVAGDHSSRNKALALITQG